VDAWSGLACLWTTPGGARYVRSLAGVLAAPKAWLALIVRAG
jgi:hypothetical protein